MATVAAKAAKPAATPMAPVSTILLLLKRLAIAVCIMHTGWNKA